MELDKQCVAKVWPPPGWHAYQCERRAPHVWEGVPVCWQHKRSAEHYGMLSTIDGPVKRPKTQEAGSPSTDS